MLVDGQWTQDWQPVQASDANGGFVRQISGFRHWITPDGAAGPTGEPGFKAEAGRYHLYVALICPWASRTLIARELKKLESVLTVSVVEPMLTDHGWRILLKNSFFAADHNFPALWRWHHKNDAGDHQPLRIIRQEPAQPILGGTERIKSLTTEFGWNFDVANFRVFQQNRRFGDFPGPTCPNLVFEAHHG